MAIITKNGSIIPCRESKDWQALPISLIGSIINFLFRISVVPSFRKFLLLTKKIVQSHLSELPEEFSIDELVERLVLIEKIETGMLQSNNGEVISDSNLDKELEKWFK